MDEREKARINRNIHIAGIAVLVAVVIYMLYAGLVLKKLGTGYAVAIGVGIFIFWLLENVVRPKLTGQFEEMNEQQMSTFKKCSLLSLAGYAGLVYFALSLNGGTGIYGALVYVVCLMIKRRLEEEQRSADADEAPEAEETDVVEIPTDAAAEVPTEALPDIEADTVVEGTAETVDAAAADVTADVHAEAAQAADEVNAAGTDPEKADS